MAEQSLWQPHEIDQLKTFYPTVQLARDLMPLFPERSLNQILCKAYHLKLRRSAGTLNHSALKILPVHAAYIAGFLDGEGSITIKRHSRPSRAKKIEFDPHVFIYNSNLEVLGWIRETLHEIPTHLRIRNENGKKNPNGKEVAELKIGGVYRLLRFLLTVQPYLIIKKRQADLLIEYCQTRVLYAPYSARDIEIVDEVQILNRRGRDYIKPHV